MSKRTRQYIGILAALAAYYLVHEGTHLLYALLTGVFKQIRLIVLCGLFSGGDMNGIALLCPEWAARSFFWCIASCKWAGILEAGTACLSTVFF